MTPSRRQQIRQLADRVREALGLTVPVDVDLAVRRLKGELVFADLPNGAAGRIERVPHAAFRITVPTDTHPNRDRFTIAHELGHLFVHLGYLVDPQRWASLEHAYEDSVRHRLGHGEEELDANEFAASFLMPAEVFHEVARAHRTETGYTVGPIAEHFQVSREAARTRGRWLGLFSWD